MSVYKQTGTPFFVYDFTVGGVRLRGSTGTATRREAEEVERQERIKAKASIGDGKKRRHTLNEACGKYMREHAATLASAVWIERTLQILLNGMGSNTKLDEIDDVKVDEYVAARRLQKSKRNKKLTVASSTVNRELQILSAVLNRARKLWKWAVGDCNVLAHKLGEPAQRQRYLSVKEAERLIDHAADHLKAPIRFSLLTGVRFDNCISLRWEQVRFDLDEMHLMVKSKKQGGKPHHLPMTKPCVQLLRSLGPKASGRVFLYNDPKIRKIRSVENWKVAFRAACRRAGIADFRWHDLRHTAATWMRRKKIPLETIQKILAHEDLRTTQRYAHADQEEVMGGLEALAEMQSPAKNRAKKPALVVRNS